MASVLPSCSPRLRFFVLGQLFTGAKSLLHHLNKHPDLFAPEWIEKHDLAWTSLGSTSKGNLFGQYRCQHVPAPVSTSIGKGNLFGQYCCLHGAPAGTQPRHVVCGVCACVCVLHAQPRFAACPTSVVGCHRRCQPRGLVARGLLAGS